MHVAGFGASTRVCNHIHFCVGRHKQYCDVHQAHPWTDCHQDSTNSVCLTLPSLHLSLFHGAHLPEHAGMLGLVIFSCTQSLVAWSEFVELHCWRPALSSDLSHLVQDHIASCKCTPKLRAALSKCLWRQRTQRDSSARQSHHALVHASHAGWRTVFRVFTILHLGHNLE